jgi:hypothetical protein
MKIGLGSDLGGTAEKRTGVQAQRGTECRMPARCCPLLEGIRPAAAMLVASPGDEWVPSQRGSCFKLKQLREEKARRRDKHPQLKTSLHCYQGRCHSYTNPIFCRNSFFFFSSKEKFVEQCIVTSGFTRILSSASY